MVKLFKRLFRKRRYKGLNEHDKWLLSLGVEITNEYINSRSFRRVLDKTPYGQVIKAKIHNWNKK